MKVVQKLVRGEAGHDLVEYSLMLAFVCLVGAAVFVSMGNYSSSMWKMVNSSLAVNAPS